MSQPCFKIFGELHKERLKASRKTNPSYINSCSIHNKIKSIIKNMKSKIFIHRMFGRCIRSLIASKEFESTLIFRNPLDQQQA